MFWECAAQDQKAFKEYLEVTTKLNVLNPATVIEDSLENAFNFKDYLKIVSSVRQDGFSATPEFRKTFNRFFRVRQKPAVWYDKYYALMEEQKSANRGFRDLLICLEPVCGTIEVSFVSKMMAAVDPALPIWDKNVLQNLGLLKRWNQQAGKAKARRIDEAERIYEEIKDWYEAFILSDDGKACIAAFDSVMPHYKEKLTAVKKIDYLLWSKQASE